MDNSIDQEHSMASESNQEKMSDDEDDQDVGLNNESVPAEPSDHMSQEESKDDASMHSSANDEKES